jgi:microcystin degradation protein MlrC
VAALGGTAVPLVAAHALPSGPLSAATRLDLTALVLDRIRAAAPLDGLVVSLHGALSAEDEPLADAALLGAIRDELGDEVPIAVTLDLHGNPTDELVRHATVITGYRTNPHVDQAATGRRAVTLLAHVLAAPHDPRPVVLLAHRPALFPDESLRMPDGPIGRIVDQVVKTELGHAIGDLAGHSAGTGVLDLSVFPTQPWLDAPGVGFTALATCAGGDAHAIATARRLVETIVEAVWRARTDLVGVDTMDPVTAVQHAAQTAQAGVRPAIVTESSDAPTAGAAGDGTGVLAALLDLPEPPVAAVTVRDPDVVRAAYAIGVGGRYRGRLGSRLDTRWTAPIDVDADVVRLGDGEYLLTGAAYGGMTATMGRYAVLVQGRVHILVTELAAWSADPGTWQHAALEPESFDVLVVKSCTDYRANFPGSAATAVVADVPGPANPDLRALEFRRCVPPPFPAGPAADFPDHTNHGSAASSATFPSTADG